MRQLADPGKAVKLFDAMLGYFNDGEHWTRGHYHDGRGNRCLVDAIEYLTGSAAASTLEVKEYLWKAIAPPGEARPAFYCDALVRFNDRSRSFKRIRAAIETARGIAQQAAAERPADLEKEEAAAARERQLLAELARERMVRLAAGDTRETFILPPRAPEPHSPVKLAVDTQREAAQSTADAEQKRLAAVAARWDLITQVQFERKSSAVRRITRHTYILCPRAPEPYAEPLRLAA